MIPLTAAVILVWQIVAAPGVHPISATLSAPLTFTGRGAPARTAPPSPRHAMLAQPLVFTGRGAQPGTAIKPRHATLAQPLTFTGTH